ncbi:SDR family NAD(P)-dependent oxidoreductase [Segniliparus rugosus]|uniref:Oxidoreductase n=1 Tax=Segniliparus rugosus (strain ATCC BAA-974 / DSM 45345 / CCUG 50838 / CIP 108380 / JCM 13579 / CDC 945) TaxID=679197 RepID=E5XNV1_SEGRC|nr:SDR family NAD(P)-dependent oxidoreductase [Segniliparus rugosus]EFV13979.1 hypothetical protein HMPREF9336_01172 [Segniliparus rugosus ATCC BAA-974]
MKINKLQPRLVVVTGAGSGIGRSIARRFAEQGASVVVSDINPETAKETVILIEEAGGKAFAEPLDVTDPNAWRDFADDVRALYGIPDVLVNNAGMLVSGRFLDLEPANWERQLSVNLNGMVYGCKAFGQQMVERGSGHIVNICSAAAFAATPVMSPYSVSKAGAKMLSDCLRLEFRPHGVGVSAICPGVINTNIGWHAETIGVDETIVQQGKEIGKKLQELMERLPLSPRSPNLVARAVTRAVRYDLAVVPVTFEGWLSYAFSRLAPSLNRFIVKGASVDRAEKLGVWALARFGGLINRLFPDLASAPASSRPAAKAGSASS